MTMLHEGHTRLQGAKGLIPKTFKVLKVHLIHLFYNQVVDGEAGWFCREREKVSEKSRNVCCE